MENTKIETILNQMKQYTVAEMMELVTTLEERFHISAKPQVVVLPTPKMQKTEFDLELTNFGKQKIQVIKLIREITDLGLKEAKSLVEQAPVIFMKEVSTERAEEMKQKFEAAGALITLR